MRRAGGYTREDVRGYTRGYIRGDTKVYTRVYTRGIENILSMLINCDFIDYKLMAVAQRSKNFLVCIKRFYKKIIIIIIINIYTVAYS